MKTLSLLNQENRNICIPEIGFLQLVFIIQKLKDINKIYQASSDPKEKMALCINSVKLLKKYLQRLWSTEIIALYVKDGN